MESDTILPWVTLGIIAFFLVIIIIVIWPELFASNILIPCPNGYCATSLLTGEKQCPTVSNSVVYDPTYQVCNIPNGCGNISTPCLYYDSTIGSVCPGDPLYNGGICPSGSGSLNCKCTSSRICPNFATVYFQQQQIPNPGSSGELFTVNVQKTVWYDAVNAPRSNLPISAGPISPTNVVFCGLADSNLNAIWPPGQCINGTFTWSQRDNLWYCTNVPTNLKCSTGQVPILTASGQYICGTV